MKKFLIFAVLLATAHAAHATSITAGPTLSNTSITFETNGTPNGTTIQFTLDSGGQVDIIFSQVSPVDSSLTQVATLTRVYGSGSGGVPQSVFWNGLWLIGTDFGRRNGSISYQVVPSTGGSAGTALPAAGDPNSLITIDSLDIHNLTVIPSLDASQLPTAPYLISYQLAKAAKVTATIADSSSTLVRTLITAQRQADETISSATITWNGLGNDRKPVPIGTYTLTVSATDLSTSDQASRTKSISVLSLAGSATNPQKLFEDNVYVFPNPVRNGQGTFRIEAIRDNANLSLKIYTITGTLVFDQSFPGNAAGSIVKFPWNVINQSGNKVGRGLYYYVVREEDSVGTLQTVKKMVVLP